MEEIIIISKFMRRKVKTLADETRKQVEKLKEIEELLKLAQQEETEKIETVTGQINELCEENNLYCGVVLTIDDLMAVIKLAIMSKENVKIPFRIYPKEE
jgi:hypothetical protein